MLRVFAALGAGDPAKLYPVTQLSLWKKRLEYPERTRDFRQRSCMHDCFFPRASVIRCENRPHDRERSSACPAPIATYTVYGKFPYIDNCRILFKPAVTTCI